MSVNLGLDIKESREIKMIYDILQLAGGVIMSFGQIPQIVQILKTKSAVDLNLKTYIMMFTGISLMESYAINLVLKGSGGAFLITNTASLLASGVMIVLILMYGRAKRDHERKYGCKV